MEYYTNMSGTSGVLQEDALPTATKKCNGAHAVLLSLLCEEADTVFGYPGGAIIPVYDALYDYTHQVNHILVRHEQAAVHAAEGYARIRRKPGVVFATSGPGATNLVTGLADALMDSVPLVCIVGQVATALLGTDAFQEANVMSITRPATKWNCQVADANEIPNAISKAFCIARSGKPGPVLVEITKSAQLQMLDGSFDYKKTYSLPFFERQILATREELHVAAQLLNEAKQPLILAGNGVGMSGAENELFQLAEKLDIPVACTLHGLSSFPSSHRLFAGMLGMHGNFAPNKLTNQADVILAIGMRFDDRVTGDVSRYAKQAKIIHVEIDPTEINKVVHAHVRLRGDAKMVLQQLLPLLKCRNHDQWLNRFLELNEKEKVVVQNKDLSPVNEQLNMAGVIHALSLLTQGNATVVADVGQHQMITARYYRIERGGKFITSGGLGTMGFSLPAAMGAAVAGSRNTVVAVTGDGCFQMNIQELATIVQYQLPVKILVLNNHHLGMVRQWQELFHDQRYSAVEMTNPDFAAIANAYGVPAENVHERSRLNPALARMLKSKGPYLLNVHVTMSENVFPMIPPGAAVDEIRLD